MNGQQLKQALHAGTRVYGTCITSPAPQWPAMVAGTGLDLVFIDTEHISLDRGQASWMCQAYGAVGLAPILRIPKPDPYLACMALDGGAAGVVAPYIESVEEVQELRGAVRYRPLKGERLRAVLAGAETLDEETDRYLAENNRGRLCIINIESTPALEALDELVQVPDLDALLIGPHDLSISLGVPEQYTHPRFEQAVQTIIRKGRAAGIGVGFHYSFGIEESIAWARSGANLIMHSSDYFLVKGALEADMARFRAELGDGGRDAAQPSAGVTI